MHRNTFESQSSNQIELQNHFMQIRHSEIFKNVYGRYLGLCHIVIKIIIHLYAKINENRLNHFGQNHIFTGEVNQ